jgi:nickel-dependent lactate racemase
MQLKEYEANMQNAVQKAQLALEAAKAVGHIHLIGRCNVSNACFSKYECWCFYKLRL